MPTPKRPSSRRGITLRSAGASIVPPTLAPERFEKPKSIHTRRVLPRIRDGVERQFHSATAATHFVELKPAASTLAAPGNDITIHTNTALTELGPTKTASNVGEPSVAINGDVVFYTGNWYAAMSSDGGKTFQFVSPKKTQQPTDPPGVTFCCDQVVHYISAIDTFVWLLQYGPRSGDNIQRLALATTAEVLQSKWHYFDITTDVLGEPGAFMDFPDLAIGANSLYVTTNIFMPDDRVGSAVFRIPFATIASRKLTVDRFVSFDYQSFRVAQHCGTTAFFAAHHDRSTLTVFAWEENHPDPTPHQVGVARWLGGNGYTAAIPGNRRWLDRADPRITGATIAGDEVWFAWGVDTNSNHRPRPFVQIARIHIPSITLLENINVFDPKSAICYGALASNAKGEVAISYMMGGEHPPAHAVGILTNSRRDVIVAKGDRGPVPVPDPNHPGKEKYEWGDYLTVRRVHPDGNLFAATGYTLLGPNDGGNRDATPRFVIFGRHSDTTSAATSGSSTTAGITGAIGTAGTTGGGGTVVHTAPPAAKTAISDVNTLKRVSNSVAAQIKAAAGITIGGHKPHAADALLLGPDVVTSPGKERWAVKTGNDEDVALVGQNIISGHDLGRGIVGTTIEELITAPRPPLMANVRVDPPGFSRKRGQPVETTIWTLDANIIALKLEKDGDYHLVLQGISGDMMIGEVPTPTKTFLTNSPWLDNIKVVRQAVDERLLPMLNLASFIPMGSTLVPQEALSLELRSLIPRIPGIQTSHSATDGNDAGQVTFKAAISPRAARITGVGFFDRVHDQTGVSQSNGIELHPILKIEWL